MLKKRKKKNNIDELLFDWSIVFLTSIFLTLGKPKKKGNKYVSYIIFVTIYRQ